MEEQTKSHTPPYTTYQSFRNLMDDLREEGLPSHITRSVVKGSNSAKSTMTASLKALGLIKEDTTPTRDLEELTNPQTNFPVVLERIIRQNYPFLFDGSIDLSNTTTEIITKKFQDEGAGGSTVSKCIAFFLAAAKEAEIDVSSRVKAPARQSTPRKKKPAKQRDASSTQERSNVPPPPPNAAPDDMDEITIPLRELKDGRIYFPKGLSQEEAKRVVKAAVFILNNYYGLDDD
mgnify:CR=1 FL=1|jgi:hypothetical protein